MKIRAAAPPTQKNEDPQAGVISSNGTPPALENATVLGKRFPCVLPFPKKCRDFFPACHRARESIQMNGLSC
ncbi:unnamed protein product, partial [Staurois parvus]